FLCWVRLAPLASCSPGPGALFLHASSFTTGTSWLPDSETMTVEVQDLRKSYGSAFTLSIPSLRIERGESFGLVGNNGAGKTTFRRLVLDLLKADQGRVTIDGEDVSKGTSWKSRTGSYLDEGFLLDFLTPSEFFDFVGSVYQMPPGRIDEAVA